jgi:hypothetical protein
MPGTVREVHQEVRIDLTDAPTLTNTIGRTRIPRGLRITYGARTDITRIDLVIEWEADAELWPPAPAHPATKEHPMSPTRIQRRRTKGWHAPDGAVYVGRGTRWGNPYRLGDTQVRMPGIDGSEWQHEGRLGKTSGQRHAFVHPDRSMTWHLVQDATAEQVVELYRRWLADRPELAAAARDELAGRDLMCWCPLPEPGQPDHCHAAVLISLANAPAAPVAR